jgi:hypothetical protein
MKSATRAEPEQFILHQMARLIDAGDQKEELHRQGVATAIFIETRQEGVFVGVFQNQFGIQVRRELASQAGLAGANRAFNNNVAETAEHGEERKIG